MANLTHEVWNYLDSETSIKKELKRGIVNSMALAKHIINAKNMSCSPDAVISAIRRYEVKSSLLKLVEYILLRLSTTEVKVSAKTSSTSNAIFIIRNNNKPIKIFS